MPHIQQLDSHVTDLIAAGEVAERAPAKRRFAGDPFDLIQVCQAEPATPKVLTGKTLVRRFGGGSPEARMAGRSTKGE